MTSVRLKGAAIAVVASILSGCSGGTIFKQAQFGDIQVLSLDARQRLVLQGKDKHGQRLICAEPSPDAIAAQAASFAAAGGGPVPGGNAQGRLAASFAEAAASIAMRTQTIQLIRDGYFRVCEMRLNNQIDEREYVWFMRLFDEFVISAVAIEALGGTVTVPPVSIGAGATSGVAGENGDANTTATPATPSEGKTAGEQGVSDERAKQITRIVEIYTDRKSQVFEFLRKKGKL